MRFGGRCTYGAAMPYPYPQTVPPEQRLRLAREQYAFRAVHRRRESRIARALARVRR
jgi:hypothetical protein